MGSRLGVLAALLLVASPCLAQLPLPAGNRTPPQKSPALARVLGILPGAGHAYAGEGRRGLAWLGAVVGVAVVGGLASDATCEDEPYDPDAPDDDRYCSSDALDIITVVAAGGLWGWSIWDAGNAAHRTNARRRYGAVLLEPTRMPLPDGGRTGVRVGLALRF